MWVFDSYRYVCCFLFKFLYSLTNIIMPWSIICPRFNSFSSTLLLLKRKYQQYSCVGHFVTIRFYKHDIIAMIRCPWTCMINFILISSKFNIPNHAYLNLFWPIKFFGVSFFSDTYLSVCKNKIRGIKRYGEISQHNSSLIPFQTTRWIDCYFSILKSILVKTFSYIENINC